MARAHTSALRNVAAGGDPRGLDVHLLAIELLEARRIVDLAQAYIIAYDTDGEGSEEDAETAADVEEDAREALRTALDARTFRP